jgi:hypothetical protein
VSAVVTTVAGAIVSIVGEVWNAALADTEYFGRLVGEALAVGGQILSRTEAGLVAFGELVVNGLDVFLDLVLSAISTLVSKVIRPISEAFQAALRDWVIGLYSAANWSISAYSGVEGAGSEAIQQLGKALTIPIMLATTIGVAIDVVLDLAAPFDIGASLLIGFLTPILINPFSSKLSSSSGTSWGGLLLSHLASAAKTSFVGFDAVSEAAFNGTHSFTSTAAGAFVDPSVPGDFWALIAVIAGAGVVSAALIATLVALEKEGPGADSTTGAASAMIFGMIAIEFAIVEYLVASVAPSGGMLGQVALAAEFSLAVTSVVFGVLAVGAGLLALSGISITSLAGAVGGAFGLVALWAGYNDMVAIYEAG